MCFRNKYYQKLGIIQPKYSYTEDPLYSMYNIKKVSIELLSIHNGENYINNKINFNINQSEFIFNIENYFKKKYYQLSFSNHEGMFILDLKNNIYLAPSFKSKSKMRPTGHIDLTLGADCLCAGTLHFDMNGILNKISLDSGHYRPTYHHVY